MLVEVESPVSHSDHFTAWRASYIYVLFRKRCGPHGRSGFHAKLNIYTYRMSEIQAKYPNAV